MLLRQQPGDPLELSKQEIIELQTLLKQDKTIYPEGRITGNYGELTRKAVERFQERYGLPVTGHVDVATNQKIKSVFAAAGNKPAPIKERSSPSMSSPSVEPPNRERSMGQPKSVGRVIATLIDQVGNPVPGEVLNSPRWLLLNYQTGKQYDGYVINIDTVPGYLETDAVPLGEYTLQIQKSRYDTFERVVKISDGDLKLGKIVLRRWLKVIGNIADQSGNPIPGHLGDDLRWELINTQTAKLYDGYVLNIGTAPGYLETEGVPEGDYDFRVRKSGYNSFEKRVQLYGNDLRIGQVILIKE
ncbi:MAG: peptidoglycan-binding domain-containing protein [Patescibacteria group bacterium]